MTLVKRGRKTCFNEKISETITRLIEEGKTEEQIARIVGVSRTTLRNWKGQFPEFLIAVREAREVADELVEASLFRRAVGYFHPETKVFCQNGEIIEHEITKYYPPDTQAGMFWLRNRQAERWKEKTEGDVNVHTNTQVNVLTDQQLDAQINELLQKYRASPSGDEILDARIAELLDKRKPEDEPKG